MNHSLPLYAPSYGEPRWPMNATVQTEPCYCGHCGRALDSLYIAGVIGISHKICADCGAFWSPQQEGWVER